MEERKKTYGLGGKVCAVTGAAGAIGEAIASLLFAQGARVGLIDVNEAAGRDLVGRLDPAGDSTLFLRADVTSEDEIDAAVKRILAKFSRLDVLVNCAGILKHEPIDEMSLANFESVVRVNLTGTFVACRAAVPIMKRQGGGKIVNIASLGGRTGRPGVGVNYAASKAGVIGLSQTLAKELGPHGIYVNAVAPGPILTELTKKVPPDVFERWNAGKAVTKNGAPVDVAEAVLFLASDLSNWITGVTLDVNGGILIR